MRILILNWRCPKNPKAGGAEFLTYEIAKRLVKWGHSVEWFSASFTGAKAQEQIAGVQFVRAGRQSTVHWRAVRRYRGRLQGRFDLVIDEINTIPFFTPLWAGIPTLTLIYQLAREVWWYESKFPLNAIGFALEPLCLRAYQRTAAVTISDSTKRDLEHLGFSGSITVMPIGIKPIEIGSVVKASVPTYIYVGRLSPSKRVEDIIRAFALFRNRMATGHLIIAGEGDVRYSDRLKRLVARLGLRSSAEFSGHLTEREKHLRMAQSHLLLMASVREGWGLVVTEANACGTPAVVYNVPGLCDAVRNGETGLVVPSTPEALAEGMMRLRNDPAQYGRLAQQCAAASVGFSLDKSAQMMLLAISEAQAGAGLVRAEACP